MFPFLLVSPIEPLKTNRVSYNKFPLSCCCPPPLHRKLKDRDIIKYETKAVDEAYTRRIEGNVLKNVRFNVFLQKLTFFKSLQRMKKLSNFDFGNTQILISFVFASCKKTLKSFEMLIKITIGMVIEMMMMMMMMFERNTKL